jgi:hypothetical protein
MFRQGRQALRVINALVACAKEQGVTLPAHALSVEQTHTVMTASPEAPSLRTTVRAPPDCEPVRAAVHALIEHASNPTNAHDADLRRSPRSPAGGRTSPNWASLQRRLALPLL